MSIPKKLYYVWIGDKEKPEVFYNCYKSWQEKMPDYEIVEINEKNFDMEYHLEKNRFFRECYERKLWAFVSDYIRINYLYEHGGIYLDVDMEIIKNMDDLWTNNDMEFFVGYEDDKYINAAIFGSIKKSSFLKEVIDFYDYKIYESPLYTIPMIFTYILKEKYNLKTNGKTTFLENKIKIYSKDYFYPFAAYEQYNVNVIKPTTYSIHWWNNSWDENNQFLKYKHLTNLGKKIQLLKIRGQEIIDAIRFKKK